MKSKRKKGIPQMELPLAVATPETPKPKKEEKPKSKREKRKEELIAEFQDGYAVGWFFAVKECFKAALDIKLTAVMKPLLKNGKRIMDPVLDKDGRPKYTKKGKPMMREKTIAQLVWTQGRYFSFSQGDVLYDTPKAYGPHWGTALKDIGQCCQVQEATPDTVEENGDIKPGTVTFHLLRPNKDKTTLEPDGEQYQMSQAEFVQFLKTGQLQVGGRHEELHRH